MNNSKELTEIKKRFDFNSTKKMIVTFGAPGAGKTTLLTGLESERNESTLISETDKILDENTLLGKNLALATEGKRKYYFQFQMAILPERFTKCFYAADNSMVDDSIFGTYAYSTALRELNWISEEEFTVFLQNFNLYMNFHPKPTKIIYLFCKTKTLQKRIKRRLELETNRSLEDDYKFKYLDALNRAFKTSAELFSSLGFDIAFVNTEDKSEEAVKEEVKTNITGAWSF